MLIDLENIIVIVICMYYVFSYLFQPNWREYSNAVIDYMTGHRISEIESKITALDNFIDNLKHNLEPLIETHKDEHDDVSDGS